MADQHLTDLTAASSIADADLLYISQGGVSKKATAALLRASTFSGCRAIMNADLTTQNITTATAVAFNGTDVFDTDGYHDPASNNSRVIAPVDGYYQIRGQFGVGSITNGLELSAFININGSTPSNFAIQRGVAAATRGTVQVSETRFLTAGQYATLMVQVDATDTSVTIVADRTFLEMVRLF